MTEVKVKTLQGKLWSIPVDPADTVATLKKKLEDKEAGPAEAQRLIFGGKILDDAKTVGEYELTKGENPAPLFLVVNPEMAKKAEEAKKAKALEDAKKAEEAKRQKAIDDAKKAAEDPAVIAKKIEDVSKRLAASKTIFELIGAMEKELSGLKKPAAGSPAAGAGAAAAPATEWSCASCTTVNKPNARRCEVCDTANPNAPKGGAAAANEAWICTSCTFNNRPNTRRCAMCDSQNPAFPAPAARQASSDAVAAAAGQQE